MEKLFNLHFNSEYSFFESPTSIRKYVDFAKNNEIKYLALTDHNNVFGFAEFRKLCEENNIKPIFGIDLDVDNFRLILLAKNNDGFNEIKKFAFLCSKNEKISINQIKDENLFIINHPNYGTKNTNELLNKYKDFYYYDGNDKSSNIFVNDNRIVDANQEKALFLINKMKEKPLEEFNNYLLETKYEIDEKLIQKTLDIAQNCNVTFEDNVNLLPIFSSNDKELLKNLIKEGLNKFKKELLNYDEKVVQDRIEYELSVIAKMNVENYFLIISDLIKWAKNQKIYIGPGRGSVSGSLIAYLIEITEINPLKYNLYFERFLNENRISMPDIDIDIQDDKRDEVIEYLKNKYGRENVAQICTFQRMGAKQSLKDVGRYLGISFSQINELSKLISGSDTLDESYKKNVKFKARINENDEFEQLFFLATQIESLPRQTGIHAAGIVISKNKVIDAVPIMNIDGNIVTQFSMEHLEKWNLLKIDLLGLRTLTIIKKIESEIQELFDKNFSINQIPLDDEKTNKLLLNGKVVGIFQLESPGMIKTLEKVKINKFSDLVDVISLFRPGPMSNIPKYIENKSDRNKIKFISNEYNEVVNSTHGIIIYQEQIMEIVQKVAKLSFAQADVLRRAISKKNKDEITKMETLFLNNALKNNINETIAKQIYEEIIKFAEYGFNKSHAVAYATISYKMAYLKVKFPICFYSSIIAMTASIENINKYVSEIKEMKFIVESPSINKISNEIMHNKKNTIYLPLTFIKGFGQAANEKLLKEFNENGIFTSFFNFVARAKKNSINNSIIDILIESNALREFGNMNTLINNKEKAINYADVIQFTNVDAQKIELDFSIPIPNLDIYEQDINLETKNEIKYLGAPYNAFATSKYEIEDKLINLKPGIEYRIALMINKKKETVNKFRKPLYIAEISDSSASETVFFNEISKDIFDSLKESSIGYANIIKTIKNGVVYFAIKGWKEI